MGFTEKDAALFLKIARSHDAQKRALKEVIDRVDHLETHFCDDEPPPSKNHLYINVTLRKAFSPATTQHKMEQFRLELLSLLEEYGVERMQGSYEKQ